MTTKIGEAKSDDLLNDIFSGYDGLGGTDLTAVSTVPIALEHLVSSGTYTLANGEVTVTTTGSYEVTFGVSVEVPSGNSRTQSQSWLERNDIEVPGTRCYHYCRQANHGATGSAQIFLSLAAGDTLRIRAQRTAGGGNLAAGANGSRLALRRL